MEQGVKDIGQRMGQAFEDKMRGQMGADDQRMRITQPDGTTTNEHRCLYHYRPARQLRRR